jgi:hypothetical protein
MIEVALSKTYSSRETKEIQKMFSALSESKVTSSLVCEGASRSQPEIFISFDDFEKLDMKKLKDVLKKLIAGRKPSFVLEFGKKTAYLGIVDAKQVEKAIDTVSEALEKSKSNSLFFRNGKWSKEADWSALLK